jgi:protein involved in polysaccharide export with SLBB domain
MPPNLRFASVLLLLVCGALMAIVVPAAAQLPITNHSDPAMRAGDVVRVEIWREEDLSGEFQVDEMGTVTLPLLGTRTVTGMTTRELRDHLISEYRVQLNNPSITVTPLRRVHVLGQVNRPGVYTVDPTTTLAGVIALAGGADASGDLRRIQLFRDGEAYRHDASADATLAAIDVRSGDQIMVGRRSWFERNTTFIISALLSVTSLVISITR